ncbi:unnamed protein product [Ilex paraguariensis]|uniref:RNase H type-1 domain-containing protein n=1 Tax=Ilex paraguariensis TaxID=185542 RepID=A0ABC8TLI6_9AQUA
MIKPDRIDDLRSKELLQDLKVECKALLDGFNLIMQHGLEGHQILIESDSQVLVQMVFGKLDRCCTGLESLLLAGLHSESLVARLATDRCLGILRR